MNHYKLTIKEDKGNQVHTFGFAYTDRSQEIKWIENAVVATKNKSDVWTYTINTLPPLTAEQFETYKGLGPKITQVVDTTGMNLAGITVIKDSPKASSVKDAPKAKK